MCIIYHNSNLEIILSSTCPLEILLPHHNQVGKPKKYLQHRLQHRLYEIGYRTYWQRAQWIEIVFSGVHASDSVGQ